MECGSTPEIVAFEHFNKFGKLFDYSIISIRVKRNTWDKSRGIWVKQSQVAGAPSKISKILPLKKAKKSFRRKVLL